MTKILNLTLNRTIANATNTLGLLLDEEGNQLGYILEDTLRPAGIKVPKKTAIPAGRYRLGTRYSNRFKRTMVCILDVPMFTALLFHGGNTEEDTEGCPLLGAKLNVAKQMVHECALVNRQLLDKVVKAESFGYQVWLTIKQDNCIGGT